MPTASFDVEALASEQPCDKVATEEAEAPQRLSLNTEERCITTDTAYTV
jgi:hypothetical protein